MITIRWCDNCRGFAPILVAIGIVSMLAAMAFTAQMSHSLANRKIHQRINRIEGFLSSEILAWHGYERRAGGLNVGSSTTAVSIKSPDQYDFPADPYVVAPGIPHNVLTTRTIAPTLEMVRRQSNDNLRYRGTASTLCGQFLPPTGRTTIHTCLSSTSAALGPIAYIVRIGSASASAAQPGKTIFMGLDRLGNIASAFGNGGTVEVPGYSGGQNWVWPMRWFGAEHQFYSLTADLADSAFSGVYLVGFNASGKVLPANHATGSYGPEGYVKLSKTFFPAKGSGPTYFFQTGGGVFGGTASLRVVSLGSSTTNFDQNVLRSFRLTGELDTTFGVDGEVAIESEGTPATITDCVIAGNNRLMLVAKHPLICASCTTLIKFYDLSGRPDETFNGGTGVLKYPGLPILSYNAPGQLRVVSGSPSGNYSMQAIDSSSQPLTPEPFEAPGNKFNASSCLTDRLGGLICANPRSGGSDTQIEFERVGFDGKKDLGFGTNGFATVTLPALSCLYYSVSRSIEGFPIVGCARLPPQGMVFVSVTDTGRINSNFGTDGILSVKNMTITVGPAITELPNQM